MVVPPEATREPCSVRRLRPGLLSDGKGELAPDGHDRFQSFRGFHGDLWLHCRSQDYNLLSQGWRLLQLAIPRLEINSWYCNCFNVAVHFKTFVQVLMAVLALGVVNPQPACAAGTVEVGKTCCCTGSPVCKCHPDKPCKQSCTLAQVRIFDKQLPGRMVVASSPHGATLLFSTALTKIKYLVLVPVAHQRDLNASPPFGGSPPQARLCLWLI